MGLLLAACDADESTERGIGAPETETVSGVESAEVATDAPVMVSEDRVGTEAGAQDGGVDPSAGGECIDADGLPSCTVETFCELDPNGAVGVDWEYTLLSDGEPLQHLEHILLIPSRDIRSTRTRSYVSTGRHVVQLTGEDFEGLRQGGELSVSLTERVCSGVDHPGEGTEQCHSHDLRIVGCD